MCRVWPLLSVDFKLTLARRDNLYTRPGREETLSKVLGSARRAMSRCLTSSVLIEDGRRRHALCELMSGKQPAPCSSNTARECLNEKGATRHFEGERTRGRRCYIKSCQVAPEARNYYYLPASSILNQDGSTR